MGMFNQGTGMRIPPDLQAIFMASNQGAEVETPPKSAFKVFEVAYGRQKPKEGFKSAFSQVRYFYTRKQCILTSTMS